MGFSMNKPNMNISYGGESNKQQKSNLMKDNPVAKHASAMNMTKAQDTKLPEALQDELPQEGRTSPTSKKGSMAHKNRAKIAKRKAMIADKKAKGVYGSSSPATKKYKK